MDMEKQGRSNLEKVKSDGDRNGLRVKRKTLETVLEQCQRALEMLNDKGFIDDEENDDDDDKSIDEANNSLDSCSASVSGDEETDELCDLLKSRVTCPDFLEKIESAQASTQQNLADSEVGSSWDVVNKKDLWESGSFELDKEDYVYVKEEDIVDGMACFMAAYLQSIKQTKDLSPTQLQEALGKTLNVKKKKGKLQKAWDGSKVIYNVASWGATAVGIYQNPAILKVASAAFWTSCHVISKLF